MLRHHQPMNRQVVCRIFSGYNTADQEFPLLAWATEKKQKNTVIGQLRAVSHEQQNFQHKHKINSNITLYYTYLKEARHVFPYVSNICKISKNNNIHHLIICGVSSFGVIHPPFSFSAKGSLTSMAKIFQSVSPVGKEEYFTSLSLSLSIPSSMSATVPSNLTWMTSPLLGIR